MEIWDRFLTDQDRAHSRRQPPSPGGIGERPVLLSVDLYRDVFGDEPLPLLQSIGRWPSSCGLAGWNALPRIERVLGAARAAGLPVVHVTGLASVPAWRRTPRGGEPADEPVDTGLRARGFEIMPQVAPIEGEAVIGKAAPSAFFGTPLVGYLNQVGADTVIVVGESTSGCVRASVVDACAYRYRVTVVADAVFDRTEAAHAMNLFDMAHKYADVVPADVVVADLAARARDGRAAEVGA